MFITEFKKVQLAHNYSSVFERIYRTTNPLIPSGIRYQLTSPLIWKAKTYSIEVPLCFITDLATVPNMIGSYFYNNEAISKAAVLHDYLYATGIFSKPEADRIFVNAMKFLGVNVVVRNVIFSALITLGWPAWAISAYLRKYNPDRWARNTGLDKNHITLAGPSYE